MKFALRYCAGAQGAQRYPQNWQGRGDLQSQRPPLQAAVRYARLFIARAAGAVVILEGEIVASDHRGVPNFARLHLRSGSADGLHLWCFDLLAINGRGWRHQPVEKRQERLQALLARFDCPPVEASEAFSDVVKLLQVAEPMKLKGVVSKRRGTANRSGDCPDWRKVKTTA